MTEYFYDDEVEGSGGKENSRTIMLKIGRANNVTRRMNEWQRQCGYALNLVRWYPYIPSSASPSNTPSPPPQHRRSQPLYPDLSKPLSSSSTNTAPNETRPSPSRKESEGVHKCPHIHRVERLIHLELAAKQVKRKCEACGKEHREWFEVAATQEGVRGVDEVVRRWVGWAEGRREGG